MKISKASLIMLIFLSACSSFQGSHRLPSSTVHNEYPNSIYAKDPIRGGCSEYSGTKEIHNGAVLFKWMKSVDPNYCVSRETTSASDSSCTCSVIESDWYVEISKIDSKFCN